MVKCPAFNFGVDRKSQGTLLRAPGTNCPELPFFVASDQSCCQLTGSALTCMPFQGFEPRSVTENPLTLTTTQIGQLLFSPFEMYFLKVFVNFSFNGRGMRMEISLNNVPETDIFQISGCVC